VSNTKETLMNMTQAAEMIGIHVSTLSKKLKRGEGPKYRDIGPNTKIFRKIDVQKYIKSTEVDPSSSSGDAA